MIMCAVCKFWQHGVCFIITEEEDAPEEHICDVCATVGCHKTCGYIHSMKALVPQAPCFLSLEAIVLDQLVRFNDLVECILTATTCLALTRLYAGCLDKAGVMLIKHDVR